MRPVSAEVAGGGANASRSPCSCQPAARTSASGNDGGPGRRCQKASSSCERWTARCTYTQRPLHGAALAARRDSVRRPWNRFGPAARASVRATALRTHRHATRTAGVSRRDARVKGTASVPSAVCRLAFTAGDQARPWKAASAAALSQRQRACTMAYTAAVCGSWARAGVSEIRFQASRADELRNKNGQQRERLR